MLIEILGEYLVIGKEQIEIGPGLNSILGDVLVRNGGSKLGMHRGIGLETKAISGKLASDLIQTIIVCLTKESTYTAAVRVATEDAGPMKNWCKVFQFEQYDILVYKSYDKELAKECLIFSNYNTANGVVMDTKISMETKEERDKSFENLSQEGVDAIVKYMIGFIPKMP